MLWIIKATGRNPMKNRSEFREQVNLIDVSSGLTPVYRKVYLLRPQNLF